MVQLRRAVPADAEALAALCERLTATDTPHLRERLAAALARRDVEVQLALGGPELGGPLVGVLVLRVVDLLALAPGGAVHVEQLWVDPQWRRRGVARSLLAAAARTAEGLGVEEIACTVPAGPPAGREVHRFLARLGFGPAVTMRRVPVHRLQRRLLGVPGPGGQVTGPDGRRRAVLDQLVARRRRQQLLTGVERRAAGS